MIYAIATVAALIAFVWWRMLKSDNGRIDPETRLEHERLRMEEPSSHPYRL